MRNSPLRAFAKDGKKKEIKDNIGYMPGDSDWDSSVPRDKDILKQHIYNRPPEQSKENKRKEKDWKENRDRFV